MDAFKDRLSQRAQDTTKPALAYQCQGRQLTAEEDALATALMAIYAETHDYEEVAAKLTDRQVKAPKSGSTSWTVASLTEELRAINADLDEAYQANGYGA